MHASYSWHQHRHREATLRYTALSTCTALSSAIGSLHSNPDPFIYKGMDGQGQLQRPKPRRPRAHARLHRQLAAGRVRARALYMSRRRPSVRVAEPYATPSESTYTARRSSNRQIPVRLRAFDRFNVHGVRARVDCTEASSATRIRT